MKKWLIGLMAATLCACWAGCEHDTETKIVEITEDTPASESSSSQSRSYSAGNLSGTWTGKAGTAQGRTVLRLSQSGNTLSGSWTWGAGDTRRCSGRVNGHSVSLKDNSSTGDSWRMTVSDDGSRMSGSAQKYGGGSYALSFSR